MNIKDDLRNARSGPWPPSEEQIRNIFFNKTIKEEPDLGDYECIKKRFRLKERSINSTVRDALNREDFFVESGNVVNDMDHGVEVLYIDICVKKDNLKGIEMVKILPEK
jgi:hypothetical protein